MNDVIPDFIKSFNPDSKLWIFQSIEPLDKQEVIIISKSINQFLVSWKSHGKQIKSASFVIKSHFIFVLVDSNFCEASGCSIDSLFKKIKELGDCLNRDFLKRNFISFQEKKSQRIQFLTLSKFKDYIKNNLNDFVIFDNSITLLSDLKNWEINFLDWESKYFK